MSTDSELILPEKRTDLFIHRFGFSMFFWMTWIIGGALILIAWRSSKISLFPTVCLNQDTPDNCSTLCQDWRVNAFSMGDAFVLLGCLHESMSAASHIMSQACGTMLEVAVSKFNCMNLNITNLSGLGIKDLFGVNQCRIEGNVPLACANKIKNILADARFYPFYNRMFLGSMVTTLGLTTLIGLESSQNFV